MIFLAPLGGWLGMAFAEVIQQGGDALGDPPVAFDRTIPAAALGVGDQLLFNAEAFAQPGRVLGRGDELCAAQVEVTLDLPGAGAGSDRVRVVRSAGCRRAGQR
jgi:hypothetical protein